MAVIQALPRLTAPRVAGSVRSERTSVCNARKVGKKNPDVQTESDRVTDYGSEHRNFGPKGNTANEVCKER